MDRNVVVGTATKASDQNYSVKLVEDDDYTGLDTDKYDEIWGNPTTGDHTYTLPTSADNPNRIIKVRHIGDGTYDFDIAPDGSDTIGGYAANFKLNGVGQFVSLISDADNSNWLVGPCLGTLLEWTTGTTIAITSPQSDTWYNPTGAVLTVTPGALWKLGFKAQAYGNDAGVSWTIVSIALSTSNTSASNAKLVGAGGTEGGTAMTRSFVSHISREDLVSVSSNTSYYLLIRCLGAGALGALELSASGTSARYGDPVIWARRIA